MYSCFPMHFWFFTAYLIFVDTLGSFQNIAKGEADTFNTPKNLESHNSLKPYFYTNLIEKLFEIGFNLFQPLMLESYPEFSNELIFAEIQQIKIRSPNIHDFKFLPTALPFCPMKHLIYDDVLVSEKISTSKHIWASKHKCSTAVIPKMYSEFQPHYGMFCEKYYIGFKVLTDQDKPPKNLIIASFCRNSLNTIYAVEILVYLDFLADFKETETIDEYILDESSFNNEKDIENFYSLDNQQKIFYNLFGTKYIKYLNRIDKHLVKQGLIDQRNHILPVFKLSSLLYINLAPMYRSIKMGSWSKIENAITTNLQGDYTAQLITGTYGILIFEEKMIRLNPKENDLKVPEAFYKVIVLQIGEIFKSIAFVTHNNPFYIPKNKICSKVLKCEEYGWNITSNNSVEGYTYCCDADQFLSKDLNYNQSQPKEILNVKTLEKDYEKEKARMAIEN